jgi:hypothetical protein
MSIAAGYTRDELRRAYAEAWTKHLAGTPLSALEAAIADVIALHPEYQALLADPERAIAYEPAEPDAAHNPFLHLGLHLAVREQLGVDRPPGIRALHRALQSQAGAGHAAEHGLMEALQRTLREASRKGRAPDEQQYLRLVRAALKR